MSHLAIAAARAEPGAARLYLYTPRIDRLVPVLAAATSPGHSIVALARSDRYLHVATTPFAHLGESEPSLLVFRSQDGLFEGRYRLGGVADLTDVQASPGILRVASSGTGQMIAFRLEGPSLSPERFTWAPTFDAQTPSPALRLRSIAEHRLELWMTALGPVGGAGPGPGGFAFNLTRATIKARHLDAPGPLLSDGQTLWMLEVGARRLRAIGDDRAVPLPGVPAGLAFLEGRLYATIGDRVVAIDPTQGTTLEVARLPAPAAALIAVEDAGDWPDEPDETWFDSHGLLLDPEGWDDWA